MSHPMEHPPASSPGLRPGQDPELARVRLARGALLVLAAAGLYQGVWAQLAPLSFFEDFPGGMSWVAAEGPFNEHLVRDVGGLVNGLAVVALAAVCWPSRRLLLAAGIAWLVYAVPHLLFHATHPLQDPSMQALNVVVLATQVVLPFLGILGATSPEGNDR